MPPHSKLLKFDVNGGAADEKLAVFGIYHEPEEFVAVARSLVHPFDSTRGIPDFLIEALARLLIGGPMLVMKKRLETIKKWQEWEIELRENEKTLHESMPDGVREVMRGKRLLLLEKIAESIGWPDREVHRFLKQGFYLTGTPNPTGVFEPESKPASMTEEEFFSRAKYLKPALWSKVCNQDECDFSAPLWEITMEEASQKGWLKGPLEWEALEEMYQGKWVPCRRFGVWQRAKWRPIDDFSENSVNLCYATMDRISLKALDETIWLAMNLMRFAKTKQHVDFTLSNGSRRCGPLHPFWVEHGEKLTPNLKTVDLKAAYKQLAIAPSERCKAVVCLKSPLNGRTYGFECQTLPFGAVASVVNFNRVAKLFQRILVEASVLATCYFDDFPIVEARQLASSAEKAIKVISSLLGFTCAVDKEQAFSILSDLLGVTLDLSEPSLDSILVRNKEGRAEKIAKALEEIIHNGSVDVRTLPSIFGRIQFAEAQILGRTGRLAMAELRRLEKSSVRRVHLLPDQIKAFELLLWRAKHGPPRRIMTAPAGPPLLLFTDGACEPRRDDPERFEASVGGVLFIPDGTSVRARAFGCVLHDSLVDRWTATGKKHLIGPTELYAAALARIYWSEHLAGTRVIHFIDHVGVQASMVSGSSHDILWRELLMAMERADGESFNLSWVARVPSHSNISDGPSRGSWECLASSFEYTRDFPECILEGGKLRSK